MTHATKDMGIEYVGEGSKQDRLKIQGQTDSNQARDQDFQKSTFGNVFLFVGGIISWQFKKKLLLPFFQQKLNAFHLFKQQKKFCG